MICDRMLRVLISSQSNRLVPIWSSRPHERLVSVKFSTRQQLANNPFQPPITSFYSTSTTSCSSSTPSSSSLNVHPAVSSASNDLRFEMKDGLPHITVPLPSRDEPCVFVLKPITHTVGDFLKMLRHEDAGIDRAVIRTADGVRIASTTSVQSLLKGDFLLVINDVPYTIRPPPALTLSDLEASNLTEDDLKRLGDVRALVGQLYEALNVEEHQALQERRLTEEMEALKAELAPLERQRMELQKQVDRRTTNLTWLGLGMMSVQFGILARLTWWEYSWDIMEPVTYFVTYGTAMACYAYFVLTKQDYVLPDVRDRQYLLSFHKKARREFWDIHKYNALKDGIAKVERDLKRLRDPLSLRNAKILKDSLESDPVSSLLSPQINIGKFKDMLKGKLGS